MFYHAKFLSWDHPNPKHPYKVCGIWTLMEHKLPEISAASISDRQHPRSESSVPMTTVGEHHPCASGTPAFRAVLENMPLPLPSPKKSQAFSTAFLLRRLGCFYGGTTTHSFRQRMGCLTTLNSGSCSRWWGWRSWQLTLKNQAAFSPPPLPLIPSTRCQLIHAEMPTILPTPCLLAYGTALPASQHYLPAGLLQTALSACWKGICAHSSSSSSSTCLLYIAEVTFRCDSRYVKSAC